LEHGEVVTGETMRAQRSSVGFVPTQKVRLHIGCEALAYEQVQRHCMSRLPIPACELCGAAKIEVP
jgi:hypothetical protein